METIPSQKKQFIDNMLDEEKQLRHAELADLSNLYPAEIDYLSSVWSKTETNRRRKIISLFIELAEENFELNFDAIFKMCLKDPDEEVRVKAIEGLWENEETILITPLINMLNEDNSEAVQAAAARGLGKYAMLAEIKKLGSYSSGRVSQALLTILNDKSKPKEVWRRALEAASPLSSVPEIKKYIEDAYKSSDLRMKDSAIYAMGRSCNSSWLPDIYKEMNSPSANSRYEAAAACGEICDDEAVPYLIKLTQDKDVDVQQAAILSLGKIGGNKAKLHLQKCLKSEDDVISEAAEQALKLLEADDPFGI